MKNFIYLLLFTLTFVACKNDKTTTKASTPQTTTTKNPQNKKQAKKPTTKTTQVKSTEKNPYWKGLQEKLNLSNQELKECKAIAVKYRKLKPKAGNKEVLKKWRKEKRNAFRELLGTKKFRQKIAYDRELRQNRKKK